jgi:hypothetical protein
VTTPCSRKRSASSITSIPRTPSERPKTPGPTDLGRGISGGIGANATIQRRSFACQTSRFPPPPPHRLALRIASQFCCSVAWPQTIF